MSSLSLMIHYGFTASAGLTGNAKLLRITDIQDGKVQWDDVPFCEIDRKALCNYLLEKDDIVIARTGGTVGKSFIISDNPVVAVFASYLIRIKPIRGLYIPYIAAYLESPCYWRQLIDATSGTGQPNVNGQSLSHLLVPIPPSNEQKRILAEVNSLNPHLQKYTAAQGRLDTLNKSLKDILKKSILQEAIQGRLVPQNPSDEPVSVLLEHVLMERQKLLKEGALKKKDLVDSVIFKGEDNKYYEKVDGKVLDISEEIFFEIPNSWQWVRLGALFSHNTGKALNSADTDGIKKKYLTTSNVYWNRFDFREVREMFFTDSELEKCTVHKGDLLVCEGGDIGRSAIWQYDEEICIQNHIHRLRAFYPVNVEFYYLVFYHYKNIGNIGGKGIGIQGLSSGALHRLIVPLPPIEEQYRITQKYNTLIASIMS